MDGQKVREEMNSKPLVQKDSEPNSLYFTSILYGRNKRCVHSFSVLWFEYDFRVNFWVRL